MTVMWEQELILTIRRLGPRNNQCKVKELRDTGGATDKEVVAVVEDPTQQVPDKPQADGKQQPLGESPFKRSHPCQDGQEGGKGGVCRHGRLPKRQHRGREEENVKWGTRCDGTAYDAEFRQQISSYKSANFANINQSLYWTTFFAGGRRQCFQICMASYHWAGIHGQTSRL